MPLYRFPDQAVRGPSRWRRSLVSTSGAGHGNRSPRHAAGVDLASLGSDTSSAGSWVGRPLFFAGG